MAAKRSYGTGSLYVRTDAAGREAWYGHWRTNGRQIKRKVGSKRSEGDRDGLTRRQAEAELRRLIAEVTATRPAGERLSVGEVATRYLADLERRGRKRTTLMAVELAVRVHLTPFFGDRALDSIRPEDVENLMGKMESDGLSPKTIRNYTGTLSALCNYAKSPRRRWASSNPCDGLELPSRDQSEEIRFLELDEVDALVAGVPEGPWQQSDRATFLAAAMSGLRQGELLALRWRDVDWPAGRIRVRQNYVRGEFGTPKSRRSTRSVPMVDRVAGELDRLYKARYGDQEAGTGTTSWCFRAWRTAGRSSGPTCSTGCGSRSGPRGWMRSAPSTTSGTRSARGWPRPACRCGPCRSGWATATFPPRRSTPTTPRIPRRRSSRRPRSTPVVAIEVAI
jgi:integrase